MLLLNFCFFHFSKFQMTIVKNLMEKPSFFIMDFEGSYEVLLHQEYFWSTYFWQWNDCPFKLFWNFYGNEFSLSFFNEKILVLFLMINLKCTVAHYASLNSSSKNMPYLWIANILFWFFHFLIYVYFNEALVKKLYEKTLPFFNTNFQNSFQNVVYYRTAGCKTCWY